MQYTDLLKEKLPWKMLDNTNILVTGANGLIASNMVDALMQIQKDAGIHCKVTAMCRNREKAVRRFEPYLETEGFAILVQNVIEPLPDGETYRYIIHAASPANPNEFNEYPVDVMKANFIGTMNILEHSRKHKGERVLFVSSSEVYGENFDLVDMFTEENNGSVNFNRFRACYPESKRAAETLCQSYIKQYGVDALTCRPAFIFGEEIIDTNHRADVSFLRLAMNRQDIVMYSKGEQVRSYLYVYDCVKAFFYILLKGETGKAYNIGDSDNRITLKEYAEKIAGYAGVRLIYRPEDKPAETVMLKTVSMILDNQKLKALGWNPTYTVDTGLKDIFG